MDQPARVQVSKARLDELLIERQAEVGHQTSSVYNTWYRKWAGGDTRKRTDRSLFRCRIRQDSGTTRSQGPYFCLWFARGCCSKGSECKYLHRLPSEADAKLIDRTTDCFGRTKFADFKDDMDGVGSFLYPCRTLFVGYFTNKVSKQKLESQFGEWGPLESVRLGKDNSIAFVTYKHEINAEFANEAMKHQTVTGSETLVVRWSRDKYNTRDVTPEQEADIREIVRSVIAKRKRT